jgi:CO/xanthine dehydrogenase FAD-binding subunit
MDVSMASVAVLVTLEGQRCVRARVAAGSVGPRPLRLTGVEAVLAGQELGDKVIAAARTQVEAEISPISDVRSSAWYRRRVTGAMVERALTNMLDKTGGGAP